MRKLLLGTLCLGIGLSSCRDDTQPVPNIITELADITTDAGGLTDSLFTDGGRRLSIANRQETKHPSVLFRVLCGYVPDEAGSATLYNTTGVHLLRDSLPAGKELPYSIISAWQTHRYVNLRLKYAYALKTHRFSYTTDSIVNGRAYLKIHHLPVQDEAHYTGHAYASIPWDSIPATRIMIDNTYEFKR